MEYRELKEKIKEIVGDVSNLPINGKVTSVNDTTCTLELSSGLKVTEVRLQSSVNSDDDKIIVIPAEGTNATALSMVGDKEDLTLIKCDKVAKILWAHKGVNFELDGETGKVETTLDKELSIETPGVTFKMDQLMKLNGDANGGLVVWPKAMAELTKLSARVDVIYAALEGATPATGTPDSGATLISGIKLGLQAGKNREMWTGLESNKVKHG